MNSSWETIPEKLEDVAIKLRKYLLESEYLQDDQLLVYQLIRSELNVLIFHFLFFALFLLFKYLFLRLINY